MLSRERRESEDTERRFVVGVLFGEEDEDVLVRLLRGHAGALGEDEKGKDRVGKHHNRIRGANEPYFEADLFDLREVIFGLYELWFPQRESQWWREQGATGADDAVRGLADEKTRQCADALVAMRLLEQITEEVRRRG
jgi:hypothetical protein